MSNADATIDAIWAGGTSLLAKRIKTEILEFLNPIDPSDPWTPESFFTEAHSFSAFEEAINAEGDERSDLARPLVERALQELLAAGKIEEDWRGWYALPAALNAPEYIGECQAYSNLKETVHKVAADRGLTAKHREGRGWCLMDGGRVVEEGPMWALAEYLGISEARRPRRRMR